MQFSKFLLAAGLGQALAQSFGGFADLTHALAARDLIDDGALLHALYARAAAAEAYDDGDDDALHPVLARALARRGPPGGKTVKNVINAANSAKGGLQEGPGQQAADLDGRPVPGRQDAAVPEHEQRPPEGAEL